MRPIGPMAPPWDNGLPFGLLPGILQPMSELIFEITQETDGGFIAECLTESIVTEADNWEQLRANVREVVQAFYFDAPQDAPRAIRLRLLRDEVLACA